MSTTTASAPRLRRIDQFFFAVAALLVVLPWAMGGGIAADKTWALKMGAMMLAMGPLIALNAMHRYADWYYLFMGVGFALAPLTMNLEGAAWVEWTLLAVGGAALVAGASGLTPRKPI